LPSAPCISGIIACQIAAVSPERNAAAALRPFTSAALSAAAAKARSDQQEGDEEPHCGLMCRGRQSAQCPVFTRL